MSRFLRWYVYFKRAHSNYTAYLVWFASQSTILYTLLLGKVFGLPQHPIYFTSFAIGFAVTYFCIAVVIGWWDFRRGTVPRETALMSKYSPYAQDLARTLTHITNAITHILEGRREEAIKELEKARGVLKKWIG